MSRPEGLKERSASILLNRNVERGQRPSGAVRIDLDAEKSSRPIRRKVVGELDDRLAEEGLRDGLHGV